MADAAYGISDLGDNVLQKRCLGSTGIWVSPLGLGTVKFGRNQGVKYPESFSLPSDGDLANLLSFAKDQGVNLLDTAPAYGSSEARLGSLLKNQRHDWVISTKVGEQFTEGQSSFDFSKQAIINSIERSLSQLKTDYVDIVLVHSNGEDEQIIFRDAVFETLDQLKQAGKLRAFGMSTKTVSGGLAAIEASDLAMVTFNPEQTADREVISRAHQINKGIFIKKVFASGHLTLSPAQHLQFALAEPGVTSVIVGTINLVHLRENLSSVLSMTCD